MKLNQDSLYSIQCLHLVAVLKDRKIFAFTQSRILFYAFNCTWCFSFFIFMCALKTAPQYLIHNLNTTSMFFATNNSSHKNIKGQYSADVSCYLIMTHATNCRQVNTFFFSVLYLNCISVLFIYVRIIISLL